MKKLLLITILFSLTTFGLHAQRLVIGEKAPALKVGTWLSASQPSGGKAQLVEFFHSSNRQCLQRLGALDGLAGQFTGKLEVIVIAKEDRAKVEPMLDASSAAYYTALDDGGRTFDAFGAQFVPFSVLVDRKGRVVWFGNPMSLDEETITRAL